MSEEMATAQDTGSVEESTSEATVVEEATGETVSETTYANGKYKSVSDLEKGYAEAQKFISQKLGGFEGAPEEYTFDEGFEVNDTVQALQEWGKENQLSNDGLISLYNKLSEREAQAAEAYKAEQMEALGSNAQERVSNAVDWVKANLGAEYAEGLDSVWMGAKSIEAIEKIMKLTSGTAPANVPSQQSVDAEKVKAMRFATNERGDRLMSIDPEYRAKVLKLEAQLYNSPAEYVVNNY